MSRLGIDNRTRTHVPVAQLAGPFHADPREAYDERGSLSGSEDGNYAPYPDALKLDIDSEDDYTALTSQTLNTDGTPKRPMNAFMIFARRRRPQVSAANQAMRTGEISKILSKEWTSMSAADKQFYQEQARQLKDSFNAKYPDYVYRRRPNNSRRPRSRKPEVQGSREVENMVSSDTMDDMGFEDSGESPTDGEGPRTTDITDLQQLRPSHHAHIYSNQENPPSHTSYGYHNASHRLHSHSTSMYSPEGHDPWDVHAARSPSWLGGGSERSFTPLTEPKVYQPPPPSSWHRPSSGSINHSQSGYILPTLNSPFFPNQSTQEIIPTHSSPHSITPGSYNASYVSPTMQGGREYNHHNFHSPSSTSPINAYHPGSALGRDASFYAERHGSPRGLPSISNYPQSQPPPAAGLGSTQGYWTRN